MDGIAVTSFLAVCEGQDVILGILIRTIVGRNVYTGIISAISDVEKP